MSLGPVPPAKWLSRELAEPHETDLGGEALHHQLATAYVLMVCDSQDHHGRYVLFLGGELSAQDLYGQAELYPLSWKADWLVDYRGEPLPLPDHLTPDERQFVTMAQSAARHVRTLAQYRGVVV